MITTTMDFEMSSGPATDMFELSEALARLGLDQYEERLIENGFDSWETVTGITETDMAQLGFKLGDRRKLQRCIREHSISTSSEAESLGRNRSLSSGAQPIIGNQSTEHPRDPQPSGRPRRQYRRHPKPDPNAPRRPKTAYVLFGEHIRKDPALSNSTFSEAAKDVGRRWGELSHDERVNVWEKPAADKLEEYKADLEQYKQTENYQTYQMYLEEFKRGHPKPESTAQSDHKALSNFGSATSGQTPTRLSPEGPQGTYQGEYDRDDTISSGHHHPENSPENMTSPIESGMDEVRHVLHNLGVNPQLIRVTAFPPEHMTNMAVEAFLHGTGSLLYLWDHDEALGLVRSAYHVASESTQLDATELFAMAAVGAYCDGESNMISVQESFLHFFLCMLSSIPDMCNFRRMRLLTCLAICRFTNSVESARRLMCK
jgi:hypothetical protein